MKKSAVFFKFSSLVWAIAVLGTIWFFPKAWHYIFVVGAVLFLWWAAYFKSMLYEIEGDNLRIISGIIFEKERVLSFEEILMTKQVSVAGKTLFTVVYFSGGRVVVFSELSYPQK